MTESRGYIITAEPEQLDILETLFHNIMSMGKAGASRDIKLFVDGDGAFHPEIEKVENGKIVSLVNLTSSENMDKMKRKESISHGDGLITKDCSEWNGEGYFIYYDFG